MGDKGIFRVVLNFTEKHNMKCLFCFLPFDNVRTTRDLSIDVVKKIIELKPRAITISGCDPFNYDFLPEIVSIIYNNNIFIHIDTNANGLKPAHIPMLREKVNLLGLPLDGSTKKIHGLLRNDPNHFSRIIKWINIFIKEPIRLKINTVICQPNAKEIENIGKFLSGQGIGHWSLYQFWPMKTGLKNNNRLEIEQAEYLKITRTVKRQFPRVKIETRQLNDRCFSYFFVTHYGKVYVTDPDNIHIYNNLGTIFDKNILIKWAQVANIKKNIEHYKERII